MREISWLRQRNFLLSPMPLSISFSRIILVSLWARGERCLNDPLKFNSRAVTVTYEPLDHVPAAIENKRLRNILIVAQITIRQFVVGKRQRILNPKLFRVGRNLFAIVFAADIQADDLQTLRGVLPLQLRPDEASLPGRARTRSRKNPAAQPCLCSQTALRADCYQASSRPGTAGFLVQELQCARTLKAR